MAYLAGALLPVAGALLLVAGFAVDVAVDDRGPDSSSEPQPPTATTNAGAMVAVVERFITPISRKLGPTAAPASPK